ncbi:uncharacterized protein JCM15063_004788 [Sporobolomyces koalae]|uniref:uncharacterized protein n=1 Tax=Sporobolomyces koalae TaxID=500713 RepID=UPI00317A507A
MSASQYNGYPYDSRGGRRGGGYSGPRAGWSNHDRDPDQNWHRPASNWQEPPPGPGRRSHQNWPDQDAAWRGRTDGGGWWAGSNTGHYNPRWNGRQGMQVEPELWSTGVYRERSAPAWGPAAQAQSRSPSPKPYPVPSSGYTTPERRQKKHQRSAPLPTPSQAYLDASSTPAVGSESAAKRKPPILILDLNHTLLCRSERNRAGSKVPLVRPYLATFLEYICSTVPSNVASDPPRSRFLPVVFSSARHQNVLSLLVALNLVPSHRLPPPYPRGTAPSDQTYDCRASEGDVLQLVWTRENMGLSERDFRGDVETTKDLEGVWKALQLGMREARQDSDEELEKQRNLIGASRTILLDDEVSKAAQQPHSLLPIKPFILERRDFPPLPSWQQKSPDDVPPPPAAVQLLPDHPAWEDRTLLSVIYQLDEMSKWGNISHEIQQGALERIRANIERGLLQTTRTQGQIGTREVEQEMERRGEQIVQAAGIDIKREWDHEWRERVLRKSGRL